MSAIATALNPPAPTRRERQTTGTWRVTRLHLRTAWLPLLVWPLVMTAVVVVTASSIEALYPDQENRAAYAASASMTTISAAFNGRGYDLSTLGGIVSHEVGFLGLLMIPLVSLILAVGRTRRQENAGRAELLTAAPIGRLAPLTGGAVVVFASLLLFGALTWAGLSALGLPADGTARYAAGLTLLALASAAAGLLLAELCEESRTATGLGLAGIIGAYLLRAIVDGNEWDAVWVSPLGWLAEIRPWGTSQEWWPVAAYAALAVVLFAAAVAVSLRRDLGAGVFASRPGPLRARPWLGTSAGQAFRLTRGAFLAWTAGLFVWGVALGLIAPQMTDIVEASPELLAALGVERGDQLLLLLSMVLSAVGALALGLQGVGVLAAEEDSGRLGLTLVAPVRRSVHWTVWLLVIALEVAVALLAGNLAVGVATERSSGIEGAVADVVAGSGGHLAAILAVVALAALVRALVPRLWTLAWAVLGWTVVVTFLGNALDLPRWARNLSPVEAVGRVPVETADGGVVVGFVLAALAGAVFSALWFGRRDLRAG